MSGVASSSRVSEPPRSSFRSAVRRRPEVADRRGHHERIEARASVFGVGELVERGAHLGSRLDGHDRGVRWGSDIEVRRDQRDACPARERRLADGDTHLPGRAVADEPDGVDRFARAARADDEMSSGQVGLADGLDRRGAGTRVGRADRARADRRDDGIDDGGQLGQPPHACLTGRELARLGLDDRVTERIPEARDVVAGGGVGPHVAVHRGCDDHRRARRERRRGHDVAGQPAGHGAEPMRGRRGDDDRVRRVGDDDVADAPVGQERKDVGLDRVSRKGLERERADERGRGRREHHDDVRAFGAKEPEQFDRFVRGDRAGDAEPDQPSLETAAHGSPSSSGSPPATSAWRIARPLSVRSGSIASMPSRSCAHGAAERPPVRIARTPSTSVPA